MSRQEVQMLGRNHAYLARVRWRSLILLVGVALALAAAPTASAGRVQTRTKADYIYLGSLGCNQERTEAVPLGPRVGSVWVVRPTVGHAFYDRTYGEYVGRITAADVVRADGRTSVRFRGRGEGATCNLLSSSTFPEQIGYRIRYRYSLAKREMASCGKVPMFWTTARVRSNGYVSSCRAARILATAWRRQMNRRRRCYLTSCRRQRVRGFRCRAHSGDHVLRVNCRRRRKVVTWAWGA